MTNIEKQKLRTVLVDANKLLKVVSKHHPEAFRFIIGAILAATAEVMNGTQNKTNEGEGLEKNIGSENEPEMTINSKIFDFLPTTSINSRYDEYMATQGPQRDRSTINP